MKAKNVLNASSLGSLHYIKQRRVIIIIGAVLMSIGFFGAIYVGSMVINDVVNNKLTAQGYPETQFLGISAFSYEYALVFTSILGLFVFFGGIFMDSKKKEKDVIRP
jgi:TRAP-type C4-dicarboxylate transport system permease small subunit